MLNFKKNKMWNKNYKHDHNSFFIQNIIKCFLKNKNEKNLLKIWKDININ